MNLSNLIRSDLENMKPGFAGMKRGKFVMRTASGKFQIGSVCAAPVSIETAVSELLK